MRAAIRVDASSTIGSGHVMRCLSLAEKLRRHGASVRFFCRALPGHLAPLIATRGFPVTLLASPAVDAPSAPWSVVPWEADATEMLSAVGREVPDGSSYDWLVVDHYGVDARWERCLRTRAARVLVLEDLADRPHDCDVLIDANYFPNLAHRYDGKVPAACRSLLGPEYALLREEFYGRAPTARERILVSFGGYDVAGQSLRVARVLARLDLGRRPVDVVIGAEGRDAAALHELCAATPGFTLRVRVSNMAELMSQALLCIGGGGITTLERLFLRVPTIALASTEYEDEALQPLGDDGYLVYLGSHRDVSDERLAAAVTAQLTRPRALRVMRFPADDAWLWQELQAVATAGTPNGR